MSACLVFVTAPDKNTAERISRKLVAKKLAACVSFFSGVRSVYRWKGRIEKAAEVMMIIKAPKNNFKRIQQEILALHPYEVPEIVSVAVSAGSKKYLDWIQDSVK